ncbi:MAG: hypothetical protein D6785_01615 [Planctomycetota bacterium]|nr:MAG: hypothetical protein D6785_01615 [Planctomycetota bacterium]
MQGKEIIYKAFQEGWLSKEKEKEVLQLCHHYKTTQEKRIFVEILCERKLVSWDIIPQLKLRLGDFILNEFLGQGASATVYKTSCLKENGLTVALKILRPSHAEDIRLFQRFEREAYSLLQLSHPNLVQGLDFGNWQGIYYCAMEYLQGRSLKDILKERRKSPFRKPCTI